MLLEILHSYGAYIERVNQVGANQMVKNCLTKTCLCDTMPHRNEKGDLAMKTWKNNRRWTSQANFFQKAPLRNKGFFLTSNVGKEVQANSKT